MKRLFLIVLLLCATPCWATDLNIAKKYWSVVNAQLGRDSTLRATDTMYTTGSIGPYVAAVNSCIRKYATHLGIIGHDSIAVSDLTFRYALSAAFIEDGIANRQFKVYGVSADRGTMYALRRAEDPSQMGNASSMGPVPFLWDIADDQFWINYNRNKNDSLFINGPIEGLLMTDGDDTTNVLEQDRSAVCDCATAIVADELGLTEKANQFWEKFVAYIVARGGTTPTRVP